MRTTGGRPIERGLRFRIVGAGVFDRILDDTIFYRVEFAAGQTTPALPVHLNVSDEDNRCGTTELNARVYELVK